MVGWLVNIFNAEVVLEILLCVRSPYRRFYNYIEIAISPVLSFLSSTPSTGILYDLNVPCQNSTELLFPFSCTTSQNATMLNLFQKPFPSPMLFTNTQINHLICSFLEDDNYTFNRRLFSFPSPIPLLFSKTPRVRAVITVS